MNSTQPAVSKIALSPNQPKVGIEDAGKYYGDAVSALLMLFLVSIAQ